jgi:hypothetical protein
MSTYAHTTFVETISKLELNNWGQMYIYSKNNVLEYFSALIMKLSKVVTSLEAYLYFSTLFTV